MLKYLIITLIGFLGGLTFLYKNQSNKQDDIPEKYIKNSLVTKDQRERILYEHGALKDITVYLPKNYVKDGSKDYTKYLQKAVSLHKKVMLPNFPVMINDEGLNLISNSVVVFNEKSKLIKNSTSKSNYDIIKISGVNNVKLFFANVEGDRYTHKGNSGEWGMGIGIWSSDNILLEYPVSKYCWGDGIYINNSTNIIINRPLVNNNRRNGVSIISGRNIYVNSLLSANNNGTAPMAGIDIEPNNNNEEVKNIVLNNPITYRNLQGVVIALGALSGYKEKEIQISINNHLDDSSDYSFAAHIDKGKATDSPVRGFINVNNPNWINTKKEKILYNQELARKNKLTVVVKGNNDFDNNTKKKLVLLNTYNR